MKTQRDITHSHYWADWDLSIAPNIMRRDTRLYWQPQISGTVGKCAGTFIGENPGGAQSVFGLQFSGYSPLEHQQIPGDPTLRLLFRVWQEAATLRLIAPAPDDYIEILNTYYFRNPKSAGALTAWRLSGGKNLYFPVPSGSGKFIVLGWGVKHNTSAEAVGFVPHLRCFDRILIPTSTGRVVVLTGAALTQPVAPPPVSPSAILMKSVKLKPSYVANLAAQLR
ncbi:MAG TPA: hypothetical protein VJU77_18965 [Chthoniobacterales bacterium]|nr:hypothetical protein [Chthoniobacterales bacterium]